MTDEQMDARLRAAGERWRDRTDGDTLSPRLPDVDEELPPPPVPRRRRTWFVAVAAAAVVALIAGLTFALRGAPRARTAECRSCRPAGCGLVAAGHAGPRSTATFYIGSRRHARRRRRVPADRRARERVRRPARGPRPRRAVQGVHRPVRCRVLRPWAPRCCVARRRYTIDSGGLTITRRCRRACDSCRLRARAAALARRADADRHDVARARWQDAAHRRRDRQRSPAPSARVERRWPDQQ